MSHPRLAQYPKMRAAILAWIGQDEHLHGISFQLPEEGDLIQVQAVAGGFQGNCYLPTAIEAGGERWVEMRIANDLDQFRAGLLELVEANPAPAEAPEKGETDVSR